jgi:hypothetical protein
MEAKIPDAPTEQQTAKTVEESSSEIDTVPASNVTIVV